MDRNKSAFKLQGLPHIYWLNLDADENRRQYMDCLLYTSPSPRDLSTSRMPSSA